MAKANGKAAAVFALATASLLIVGCQEKAAQTGRPTPSGLPVPRYVSLKFDEVNARAGPGEDHRVLWVYRVQGLPVQVIAETRDWRRVCDPSGGVAWVRSRVTDGRRTVMRSKPDALPLHAQPKISARVTAYLQGRSVIGLDKCEDGWCRLKAGSAKGWAPQAEVWGVAEEPQCR